MLSVLKAHGLSQVINEPTRKTRTTATILEVIYVKTSKRIEPMVIDTCMSDHYLVATTAFLNYKAPPKIIITGRSYNDYSAEQAREFYNTK